MQKHIITIGGLPGSGKSSAARRLAEMLQYHHFSSGDFFREIAIQKGVTIDELMAHPQKSVDDEVDALVRQKGEEEKLVIDSRTAFHWIPQSFKVFLTIDPQVGAKRVFAQLQKEGRPAQEGTSVEDVYAKMIERIHNEKKRYISLYNFDYTDQSQYDLVVDTAHTPLEEEVQIILKKYQEWINTPV